MLSSNVLLSLGLLCIFVVQVTPSVIMRDTDDTDDMVQDRQRRWFYYGYPYYGLGYGLGYGWGWPYYWGKRDTDAVKRDDVIMDKMSEKREHVMRKREVVGERDTVMEKRDMDLIKRDDELEIDETAKRSRRWFYYGYPYYGLGYGYGYGLGYGLGWPYYWGKRDTEKMEPIMEKKDVEYLKRHEGIVEMTKKSADIVTKDIDDDMTKRVAEIEPDVVPTSDVLKRKWANVE